MTEISIYFKSSIEHFLHANHCEHSGRDKQVYMGVSHVYKKFYRMATVCKHRPIRNN